MYIVSAGECAYTRRFPPKHEKTATSVPIFHMELNIGLNLFAGHFSFMDGCMVDKFMIIDDETKKRLPNARRLVK